MKIPTKVARISVRMLRADIKALRRIADRKRVRFSDWVRLTLEDAAKKENSKMETST